MTSAHIYLSVLGLLTWSTCLTDARPSFSRDVRKRLVEALRSRRTVSTPTLTTAQKITDSLTERLNE